MNYNVICETIFILYIIFYINTNDKEEKGRLLWQRQNGRLLQWGKK